MRDSRCISALPSKRIVPILHTKVDIINELREYGIEPLVCDSRLIKKKLNITMVYLYPLDEIQKVDALQLQLLIKNSLNFQLMI